MNQDSPDSPICLPVFYLSKQRFNLCLIVKYGPEKNIFEWKNCNHNDKAQRWVKISSKERPAMIQLCHADGQKKCLIASNQMNEEIKNSAMLANYQSLAKVSPAQLWKLDTESRYIMNVEYSSCLADITAKNSSRVWLFTTKCEENEVQLLRKQWYIKPVFDKNNGKVICASFQIPRLAGSV